MELKNDKGTEYIISCNSKGICNSKLIAFYAVFLPDVKYFRNKKRIQRNSTPLVRDQNNYTTKIVNDYIVFDLDNWPKNLLRNFTLKMCFFGLTNVVKNNDKETYVYSGYGIAFDRKDSWIFNDDLAKNVIIFRVDNSSSTHPDNLENNFSILREGDTFGINVSFGTPEKKLTLILVK